MSEESLSVSTMIRGRFRLIESAGSPPLYTGASAGAALREDAPPSSRQTDAVMRLLMDMDRKLDSILGLLQRETLAADFPGEGHIVRISASGLVLECRQSLATGQHMELLLLLEELPLRLVSVIARIVAQRPDGTSAAGPGNRAYDLSYNCPREEDREAVIRFVFSEQRRLIRRRRGGETPNAFGRNTQL